MGGAPDLRSYLGVRADAPIKEALVGLERKRQQMEGLLTDPQRAREAELFLESYGILKEAVHLGPAAVSTPADWYQVLGVRPDAPFAAIERAWRSARTSERDGETLVAQAWRVLGNPAARASYDRTRHDHTEADNRPGDEEEPDLAVPPSDGSARVAFQGPELRDVDLDPSTPTSVVLPLVVKGSGRWRGTLKADHPAVSTQPERIVSVGPGRHTIAVTFDPTKVKQRTLTVTLTLGNGSEQHAVAFRLRRPEPGRRRLEWVGLGVAAAALLVVGWGLASVTRVESVATTPDSVGDMSQIPTLGPCLTGAYAPLPSHIDVHVDGLGRPTGVSFGGPASRDAEACVREVVLRLEFPPTPTGRQAFHRYLRSPSPSAAP